MRGGCGEEKVEPMGWAVCRVRWMDGYGMDWYVECSDARMMSVDQIAKGGGVENMAVR